MTGQVYSSFVLQLIEFPADDLDRARRFWEGVLGTAFDRRKENEGRGLQSRTQGVELGLHERGPGPGDRWSLPYFEVGDVAEALDRVVELGGEVIHPGERWAICRDSEGSPFGLARRQLGLREQEAKAVPAADPARVGAGEAGPHALGAEGSRDDRDLRPAVDLRAGDVLR